jgi:signal peptidase I
MLASRIEWQSSMRDTGLFHALVEEALAAGTVVRFRAEGTSMYPTIRDGEVITIAPVPSDDVVHGDVLLCRHDVRLLAHRLVAVTTRGAERQFLCRGDAKAGCDTPVGAAAVVGRVISVYRNGRAAALCGRRARLRHAARRFASRARVFCGMIPGLFFTHRWTGQPESPSVPTIEDRS